MARDASSLQSQFKPLNLKQAKKRSLLLVELSRTFRMPELESVEFCVRRARPVIELFGQSPRDELLTAPPFQMADSAPGGAARVAVLSAPGGKNFIPSLKA